VSKYDDKFRASAVIMLQAEGYPDRPGALMKIAKHLKVPKTTLSRWYNKTSNPPPPEIVTEKKTELKEYITLELGGIFEDMPNARSEASYKDLATAAGILIDKLQLLNNEPTERNDTTIRFVDDTSN
jgi:hypothetical protein